MATPTLQDLSIRLSAVDGVGAAVPSLANIPVIQTDLNGLHTTLNQLVLTLQTQWNSLTTQLQAIQVGLAGETTDQAARAGAYLLTATTMGGPYTVNFAAPYADGSYTTEVTVTLGEAISTAACYVAGVKQQNTAGNGVLVWVYNGDSVNHNITINLFARHD